MDTNGKFCRMCGTRLELRELENEGIIPYCPECGQFRFPQYNVAVSMIVVNEAKDEILLIQQYGRPSYVLVAGYVTRGESLEDAVAREVKEETGMTVSHARFNRTQFFEKSDTLMCNFTAFVKDDSEMHANYEIDSYRWFSREDAAKNIRPDSLAEFFLVSYLRDAEEECKRESKRAATDGLKIRLAELEDMNGIKALLRKYHRDTISDEDRPDGFVTTAITDEQLADLIVKERGVMLITGKDKVLGFCFAAPWDFWQTWPLFRYMMDIIPDYSFEGKPLVLNETYQYGPVCVDSSIRGTGAFEKLFRASLAEFSDRFPVMLTFVNQINGRSVKAHTEKAHMDIISKFDFNDNHYYLMGIRTGETHEDPEDKGK